jgi:flagellar assembly protein FliH
VIELRRRDAAALDALADDVVELVMGLTTTILAREVEADTEPGRSAIRRALQLAPDRGELRARLHPDDIDSIGDVADLHHLDAVDRPIELVADLGVERGGCVLEAGPCRIDAQVGAALARARAALEGVTDSIEPPGARTA